MQEPMLTFRRVTKERLKLEYNYPSSILLSACICILILYICYLYPGFVLRGGALDAPVFIATLVLFVLVAGLIHAISLMVKQASLLNKFFISPKSETLRHSLYICGALALLIVLYCTFALRPLQVIPVAVGTIFSITAFWPYAHYGLKFVKSSIQDIWRRLLRRPYTLEIVLVDPRKAPSFEEQEQSN